MSRKKRSRSAGVRHPVRNTILFGLVTLAGIVLVVLDVLRMNEPDRSGSPMLMIGLLPALLGAIFFIYYFTRIRVFRDMRSGRTAIARWTVPADQFLRFRDEEDRIPAGSIMVNFYNPPKTVPAEGVEVIFSDSGVLIGDGYFPLSLTGGRQVQSVRQVGAAIEFGTALKTAVRTSSATVNSVRTDSTLRVPVAADATREASEVLRWYQGRIGS